MNLKEASFACKEKQYKDKIAAYKKQFAHLSKVLHKKNIEIDERISKQVAVFNENQELEKLVRDKDAVLSDVSEECRLSKVREEKLTEVCQKYLKEIEELKKDLSDSESHKNQAYKSLAKKNEEIEFLKNKLANIVVNNVDAQALKSAESALAYKDKAISRLKRKNALLKKKNSLVITHNLSKGFDDFMEIVRLW